MAVLPTFTTTELVPALAGRLTSAGVDAEIHLAGFDQLMPELCDPAAELTRFGPDITLCAIDDSSLLPRRWDHGDVGALESHLVDRFEELHAAVTQFIERTGGAILLHTVPLEPLVSRGLVGHRDRAMLGRLWRELNCRLLAMADHDHVHVVDLEAALVDHADVLRDNRLNQYGRIAWSNSIQELLAEQAAVVCRGLAGVAKKVLVTDLDNTLWGGVLGDDGIDGIELGSFYPGNCFVDFQRRLKALRQQGVLLAICSKNEAVVVDDVFARHPEMELGRDDFVAAAVNWNRKDENIRALVHELGLRLDSVVFVDDSEHECDLVRTELPEVTVVQLTGDPADHADQLFRPGYFDVPAITATDRERTGLYQARTKRATLAAESRRPEDYLRGLELRVAITEADAVTMPRLEQLLRRTNQFKMAETTNDLVEDHLVLGCEVADRFGRDGIVAGVWLARREDHWSIENMVMSCRVFARGIEHAVLDHVIGLAVEAGVTRLAARFTATGRNQVGGRFYPEAGFARAGQTDDTTHYTMDLDPRPRLLPDWITPLTGSGVR